MPRKEIDFYGKYAGLYDLQWGEKDKPDDIAFWVKLAKKAKGRVLELACGTGRVTLPIARSGVQVTGLDVAEGMLSVFRKKLPQETAGVRKRIALKHADMRNFDFKEKFSFAFVPFNSFLHLESVRDEEKCIRSVHRSLKPNGVLAIEVFNPDFKKHPANVLRVDLTREDSKTGAKVCRLSTRWYKHKKQLIHHTYYILVVPKNEKAELHETGFTLRYIKNVREMHGLLSRRGFKLEKVYGDYKCKPFTKESEKMIFVARKA